MIAARPRWDTASDPGEARPRPVEQASLGEHQAQCSINSGSWVALRCTAAGALGFLSARLITCVAVAVALVTAVLVWL